MKAAIKLPDGRMRVTVSVVLLCFPENLNPFTAIPVTFRVTESFNNLKRICSSCCMANQGSENGDL
jgi:hypothetical protein